jgi:ATP-dependent RNA helicase DDX10/DBP4
MGFRDQLVRILEYLPTSIKNGGTRQTLLFSATQTKRVADLAALSLHRPEYIGVHDKESSSTPELLEQSLIVVPLENKLDAVFSFIKSHLKKKSIIFFSTCSQVRYVLELFSSLQPGVPIMALHGKLSQERRTRIYMDFIQRPYAVLFATDIAARGLDFPNVDWVVQADAPEDKDMYIHRVGRTARYNAGGKAMLMLLPSEKPAMAEILEKAKVPIKKLSINPSKTVTVSQRSSSIVASNPVIHTLAKKAFKSYIRSIYLMPDKDIFQVSNLPLDAFAASLGLAATPALKFLKEVKGREDLRSKKNVNLKLHRLKEQIRAEKLQQKIQNLDSNEKNKSKTTKRTRMETDESSQDEDLLVVKKAEFLDQQGDNYDALTPTAMESLKTSKRIRIEGSSGLNKRIVFNDDGDEEDTMRDLMNKSIHEDENTDLTESNKVFIDRLKDRLKHSRMQDRLEESRRIKEKHKKRKMIEKGGGDDDSENDDGGFEVTLGKPGTVVDEDETESGGSNEETSDSGSETVDDDEEIFDNIHETEDAALALIRTRC